MTLRIDAVAVAEGAAQDVRGAWTLVGFNPPALPADSFPARFGPAFLLIAEDDGEHPVVAAGTFLNVKVQLTGPDGETLFFAQDRPQVQPWPNSPLPRRIQLVVQVPFTAGKAGEYRVYGSISADDPVFALVAERTIRVVDSASIKVE
ncbi:MAG: hypothetical protein JOZ48_04625 [Acidobacteriaceae bacterium]|nr:hypothetical protein [Acidobacteriaceae bacterium]